MAYDLHRGVMIQLYDRDAGELSFLRSLQVKDYYRQQGLPEVQVFWDAARHALVVGLLGGFTQQTLYRARTDCPIEQSYRQAIPHILRYGEPHVLDQAPWTLK
jgi:hypothetical protein